jgi:CheY-like chemotaxis protein/chemotaxis signal transduction protein
MGLPLLLLVDDSEVVLAYERSVLAAHYALATAVNGREALEKIGMLRPAAVLLDLSMPVMTGDEVLERMLADPEMKSIPVIIVSSEVERGEAAKERGAVAFIKKPIQPDMLRAAISGALEEVTRRRREGGLRLIMLETGPIELGVELADVESVMMQPSIAPLSGGPGYLLGIANIYGEPITVLDMARRLGVEHAVSILDRKLVVVVHGKLKLALCVDKVHDPLEIAPEQVIPREQFAGTEHEPLRGTIRAVAQTPRGHRLVIDPAALISRAMARRLSVDVKIAQLPQDEQGDGGGGFW